ncbi:MAG: M16 family metallopeptidase [Myxococcota bacterium]
MIAVETLPNGLVVLLEEDRSAPRVAVHVYVEAGAAEDPPGREGLAHLVEHLAFAGGDYDRRLAALGGASNAWTDHDGTAYWSVAPSDVLGPLLALEGERFAALAWPDAALATQRGVVAQERAGERLPGGLDHARLSALLWPEGHPYRRRVLGEPDAVTAEDARAFVARQYRAGATTVAIVGDFDLADARARVYEALAGLPAGAGERPAPSPPGPLEVPARARVRDDVDRPVVYLGWRGPPRGDPDAVALAALAALVERTEVPEGVTLEVRAWSGEHGGSFVVRVRGRRGVSRAVRAVERAIASLAEAGPPTDALARVRARERAAILRATEAVEARAQVFNLCWAATRDVGCVADVSERWAALDAPAVARAAARWLDPRSRATLVVTPPGRPPPRVGR